MYESTERGYKHKAYIAINLATNLQTRLRFIFPHVDSSSSQGEQLNPSGSHTTTIQKQSQLPQRSTCVEVGGDDPLLEERAWANFCRSHTAALNSDPDQQNASTLDHEFCQHCRGHFAFVSHPPKGCPPLVAPPNYLVETLTGLTHMDEQNAREFLTTYCQLCRILGTGEGINIPSSVKVTNL